MPRPAAAAVQPDPTTGTGQTPAHPSPFVTRFPLPWVAVLTGDHLRAVTTVGDYARGRYGYCWAADRTLAGGLDLHPDTVGAGLRAAERAGLVRAVRRPGGTSARVLVLPDPDEDVLWVCVSSYARNRLPGALFGTYAVLAVREHLDSPTSIALIATLAGIGQGAARAAVAELTAAGWITRTDTTGRAARYTVHPAPIPGIPTQLALDIPLRQTKARRCAPPAPVPHAEIDGQLGLFDPADLIATPAGLAVTTPADPAVTTPAGSTGQARSLQQDLSNRPAAVGGCGSGVADPAVPRDTGVPASTWPAADRPARPSATPEPPTSLPPLTVTEPIYHVLAHIPTLVHRMSRWEQRQAARAVGQAIRDADGDVARVAARLVRRYARISPADVRRPSGWLAEIGLVRRGCDLPHCEDGRDAVDGRACRTCELRTEHARDVAADRRRAQRGPRPVPAPRPDPDPAPAAARPARPRCPDHPTVAVPCALCAAAAAVPGPEPDTSTGRELREQLAARRRAREGAADQAWAAEHGIAWTA
ncbi:hypothetical protein [Kitasatospora sp. NPDC002965]|uniref:hypothetical protein n=1 Tax=Kitasatospora sp. NPDC002965 TaxID=3154775 RepID=UPI0033A01C86